MGFFPPMTDERREALRLQENRRRELAEVQRDHVCAECGGLLGMWTWRWGWDSGPLLACMADPDHVGFRRQPSLTELYDQGYALPLHIVHGIERRRRKHVMQNAEIELAPEEEKALQPYYGVPALTQEQATLILRTIWPKAPDVEVFKAALICKTYALNPLMKHVYLLPFDKRDKSGNVVSTSWAAVLGIVATRLIASRIRPYSYVDGPRAMTEEEQATILGEVDKNNIWAITVIADRDGLRASGYGNWPKGKDPYGTDKGNTKINMAMIRSERAAFNRLFPGEMPADLDTIDTSYLPAPQDGQQRRQLSPRAARAAPIQADPATGEVIDPPEDPAEPPLAEPPLKNVNDLTRWAEARYGLKGSEVYRILGVKSSVDIGDLEDARAKVVASQEG